MIVALSGASGLIGAALCTSLRGDDHQVRQLGRRATAPDSWLWDALVESPPAAALDGVNAVIHLSGEPIAQRWTAETWQRIVASRVEGTRRMVDAMKTMTKRPAVFISASATGIYGDRGDEILTEASSPGAGVVAQLCQNWEREALRAESLGVRVVLLRTGLVLSPQGGALQRMMPAFRLGLGGPLGDGQQWMSWIHLRDMVRLIRFTLEQPALCGPLNATAPEPATNRDFTRTLAATLRRPAILPVPRPVLRLLFGEMAEILTSSQRVLPEAAQGHGFSFEFPTLEPALQQMRI